MNRSAGCPMAAGVSYPGARFLKRPAIRLTAWTHD
ncbi:Uncharacterised protein [Pannonibacter phragmitetus]|uniref:Uncharacterized protein n=1 Tax=Pannonibacter phragmitetus TaxID=121719 RepID=A0A378ZQB6_9HYPH|nr:Uncharacterised protein [Pannonibacter phragmitetus]